MPQVKLWKLDGSCEGTTTGSPWGEVDVGEMGGECLSPHPTAADLLAVGTANGISLLDVAALKAVTGTSLHSPLSLKGRREAIAANRMEISRG